ncbi:phage holin family protein [Idiomarina piscisalsi]|uniref:Holin n=1 Tax=Idiomarina piscisalsi TaxID=1096243 RepID=A0A432YXD2_9GAMM|nr:phage holin family protein [Idiomarina piscisalsi]RUO67978.1 hypothetical protein CWI73_03740 [Idiomarina piscisalsi]
MPGSVDPSSIFEFLRLHWSALSEELKILILSMLAGIAAYIIDINKNQERFSFWHMIAKGLSGVLSGGLVFLMCKAVGLSVDYSIPIALFSASFSEETISVLKKAHQAALKKISDIFSSGNKK